MTVPQYLPPATITSLFIHFSHASYSSHCTMINFSFERDTWSKGKPLERPLPCPLGKLPSLAAHAFERLQPFLSMPNLYLYFRSELGLRAEWVIAHIWYSSHQHVIFGCSIHCFPVWYGRDNSSSWQVLPLQSMIKELDAEIMGGKNCS